MKMNNIYLLSFIFLNIFSWSPSLASEGAPKSEEKKAEEGGGSEHGGGGASKKKNEFMEVQSQVAALQAKVKAQSDMVINLIQHKAHEKNPAKIAEINQELSHAYKELTETNKQYEQKRALFLYRFPEKGLKTADRRYQRIEMKSLQDMEKQVTLDSKIKVSLEKAKTKYHYQKKSKEPNSMESGLAGEADQSHHSEGQSKTDEKEIPSLTEPIVIRK